MNVNGGAEGGNNDGDQRNPGPIVHVRADSDSTLEDLFAIVQKPPPPGSVRQLTVPLRLRKLPPSFFKPPMSGSKSPGSNTQEASSTGSSGEGSMQDPFSPGGASVGSPPPAPSAAVPPPAPQLPVHNRAHSSPATLQQTLAVAQQQQQQHQPSAHLRQGSYDDGLGPLPDGWDMSVTKEGQVYFMNHETKTTTWEDPRKQTAATTAGQQQLMQLQQLQQQQQQNGAGLPNPSLSPQPAPPAGAIAHQRSQSFDNVGALPQGWEQGVTPDGDIYFINHTTKKTTWFDPRIPIQNQRVPIRQFEAASAAAAAAAASAAASQGMQQALTPAQKRQQDARLQRLENERRALQQRQAELKKQLERRSQSQENMQAAMNQTQEMFMRQTITDADPFLGTAGGAPSVAEMHPTHPKQESTDSGVGGMGSNFNLGSIPEVDMDSAMDTSDLDTTAAAGPGSAAASNAGATNGSHQVGAPAPPASASASAAAGGNAMDSTDQLIPSLSAELGDVVLPQDIMQDVLNTNKGDAGVLTWL